jgi:hypothetical protein
MTSLTRSVVEATNQRHEQHWLDPSSFDAPFDGSDEGYLIATAGA